MEIKSKRYLIRSIYLYAMCGVACLVLMFKITTLCGYVVDIFAVPETSLPYSLKVEHFGQQSAYKGLSLEKIEELRQQKVKIYNTEKISEQVDAKNRRKNNIIKTMIEIFVWTLMLAPHLYFVRRSYLAESGTIKKI